MKMKLIALTTLLALSFSPVSFAEEMPTEGATHAPDAAMMAKMKEATSPGEAHKILEPLAGSWTYTAKFWMSPDAEPQETTGTSEQTLVYGGRFLEQKVTGTWMGEAFEGTGILGYDNVKQEYTSLWYDNMMTGVMSISGQYNPETKTLDLSGVNSCPMMGKDIKNRAEYVITDSDHNTYTSYMVGPDGQEVKAMEIVYTRA